MKQTTKRALFAVGVGGLVWWLMRPGEANAAVYEPPLPDEGGGGDYDSYPDPGGGAGYAYPESDAPPPSDVEYYTSQSRPAAPTVDSFGQPLPVAPAPSSPNVYDVTASQGYYGTGGSTGVTSTTSTSGGSATVREAQSLLAALGYYAGTIDGLAGTQTRAAVTAFQRDQGLTVDGKIGEQTLAALRYVAANIRGATAEETATYGTKSSYAQPAYPLYGLGDGARRRYESW